MMAYCVKKYNYFIELIIMLLKMTESVENKIFYRTAYKNVIKTVE